MVYDVKELRAKLDVERIGDRFRDPSERRTHCRFICETVHRIVGANSVDRTAKDFGPSRVHLADDAAGCYDPARFPSGR